MACPGALAALPGRLRDGRKRIPPVKEASVTLLIRERPRLALMLDIATPGSTHARWAPDEHQAINAPSNVTFSTTMPGGFETMSCTLTRKAGRDYPDLEEFSTVTVSGIGGQVAWQGRLETTPRTSGDQLSITPGAVGWQAALDDDQSARMIYLDADLMQWQPASSQRKINAAASSVDIDDPAVLTDQTTGQPALDVGFTSPWSRAHQAEAYYDAKGISLQAIYYAWKLNGNIASGDANWTWQTFLSSDDVLSSTDASANLRAAGPGTGSLAATTTTRDWAMALLAYAVAVTSTSGIHCAVLWTYLGVVGNHGLTIQGTLTATGGLGVLASDVVQHAVQTWAPELATSRAGVSTIETSTFSIPHLVFTDPTTASAIIKQATVFGLPDWWVDEGPTFNLASRDNHGRRWRARVGPSGLQETGPQVDRLFNSVIVSYNDVTGVTRTVGPTGSGANTIDDSLTDTDPANPVNVAGITRRSVLAMGITSTAAAALQVGQDWLAEQKLLSTAGQAQIVGHVEDDHGVLWPAWMIRAGDQISFTDAHSTDYRRVVRAEYSDASRACQLDLDSPPEGLSSLLARLSVSLTPLGLS